MVTEADANGLLAENKVIGANVTWKIDGNVSRQEATVLCIDSERTLSLRGFYGKKNRSFVLLFRNTPIRKYTVHASHKDPVTRQVVRQPHKHWWNAEWGDKRVYIPNDIRIGNLNEEFLDFLQECNIELRGVTLNCYSGSGNREVIFMTLNRCEEAIGAYLAELQTGFECSQSAGLVPYHAFCQA